MASRRRSNAQILAQIPAATARAAHARRSEPHATSARYDAKLRLLHVELANGSAFSIPVRNIPGLGSASNADLATVEVGPYGVGLRWDALDADLSVAALARIALGSHVLMRAAGAAGGAVRSKAKAEAARRNGLKGGRPKKRLRSAHSRRDRHRGGAAT